MSLSLLSSAAAGAASAPVRVNIGAASVSSSALSLWAAQEQGIFAKHGVEAQLILIRGGSTLVASLLTGEIQAAFTSGVSVLGAAAQGVDVKMLTSISSRVSWKLIANPQIKKAEELRGKRFGVQSIVGSTWMYAMLALEQLGLEPKRDNISFLPIGDPVTIGHALEAGRIDAAVLDPALSQRLTSKGFLQLVDLAKTNATFPGLGVGVTRAYLEQHTVAIEKLVAALTEGLVFVQQPVNKPIALKILMKHLRISDPSVVENGYQDHLLTLNRKPYPSLDGLRNAQRLMTQQNPKIATLKVEELVDSRFVRKLDDSGFIDRLYAAPR
ncbi:MAG TPA: ABC transporter substrate-binding protein [Candidatus Binatia bacterium]|jgi:NitT/TauT family transport system substrate-binding protein|nr:ABC transporter substrate-binding protein [Candidatus Binatia bacterium]